MKDNSYTVFFVKKLSNERSQGSALSRGLFNIFQAAD
jgi:hypothetical protein